MSERILIEVKHCCKCRPMTFWRRTRKIRTGGQLIILEAYCEGHTPLHGLKGQSNVEAMTAEQFNDAVRLLRFECELKAACKTYRLEHVLTR